MSSKTSISHMVSDTQPLSAGIGDEWYNSKTNTLYKNISYNAISPQWIEFFSTTPSNSTASFGNLAISGNLTVGSGGSLNVTNLTQIITMAMAGVITPPVTGTARYYPTRTITLTAVNANLGAAPSGDFKFILKKNGSQITNNIFTITAQNPLMTTIYTTAIQVNPSDYLTVDIQTGSASGNDLSVKISYV
jgi:hypothetical protein